MNKGQIKVSLVSAILLSMVSAGVGVALADNWRHAIDHYDERILQRKIAAILIFGIPIVLIGGVLNLRTGSEGKDNGPG